MTPPADSPVDVRLALGARLGWMFAASVALASLPSPSVRAGATALAGAASLAIAPGSTPSRIVAAAACAALVHESTCRGAFVAAALALLAAALLFGVSRHRRGLVDFTAASAAVVGVAVVLWVPGAGAATRLPLALAWVAAAAGSVAGWRLAPSVARSRWIALPFAAVAVASALSFSFYRQARYAAADAGWLKVVDLARRSAVRTLEREDAMVAARNPYVSPADALESWRRAFLLGAGEAAWIERVAILRAKRLPQAGPETHRLILHAGIGFPQVRPSDDFPGRLLFVTGRHAEAAEMFRRWDENGGGFEARLMRARALLAGGLRDEARAILAELPQAKPEVACARTEAGDPFPFAAARCGAAHPFHRASIEALRDRERLAALPPTDPVDEEFGGSLRLVGRRVTLVPGGMRIALLFEGLTRPLDPALVVPAVRGPGAVTLTPASVEVAPDPGDLVWAKFDAAAPAPGEYEVELNVETPWGPWLRTRRGRPASDWPYPLSRVVVP